MKRGALVTPSQSDPSLVAAHVTLLHPTPPHTAHRTPHTPHPTLQTRHTPHTSRALPPRESSRPLLPQELPHLPVQRRDSSLRRRGRSGGRTAGAKLRGAFMGGLGGLGCALECGGRVPRALRAAGGSGVSGPWGAAAIAARRPFPEPAAVRGCCCRWTPRRRSCPAPWRGSGRCQSGRRAPRGFLRKSEARAQEVAQGRRRLGAGCRAQAVGG